MNKTQQFEKKNIKIFLIDRNIENIVCETTPKKHNY